MIGLSSRYTPECTKLLAQYKTTLKLLGDAVPSLDAFVSEHRVREPLISRQSTHRPS